METHNERRQFKRIKQPFMLKFRPWGNPIDKSWDLTTTKNISAGGVLFTCDRSIQVGSIVEFGLTLPISIQPLKVIGKVIRVEKKSNLGFCDVAVEFTDIDEKDKGLLDKTVSSCLS